MKVIFTDLDGTLLDSRTYSFEAARPALELIRKQGVPLVLCSSKTQAELELLRKRLNNTDPYVSENGGGIFVPKGYFPFPMEGREEGNCIVVRLGLSNKKIRKVFEDARERVGARVTGFGDMTAEQIAELTGLPRDEAALAAKRDFGEAFVFEKYVDERFLKELEDQGLHWTQGRLYHVMGENDKGKAVRLLKKWYEMQHDKIVTIGLGDAPNDLPLLEEADFPVLVQKNDGDYDSRISVPGLILAPRAGPAGWNESVLQLLSR